MAIVTQYCPNIKRMEVSLVTDDNGSTAVGAPIELRLKQLTIIDACGPELDELMLRFTPGDLEHLSLHITVYSIGEQDKCWEDTLTKSHVKRFVSVIKYIFLWQSELNWTSITKFLAQKIRSLSLYDPEDEFACALAKISARSEFLPALEHLNIAYTLEDIDWKAVVALMAAITDHINSPEDVFGRPYRTLASIMLWGSWPSDELRHIHDGHAHHIRRQLDEYLKSKTDYLKDRARYV